MKAVILAGGLGTRIAEESEFRPKPMIEIGGFPILWHILKIYSNYGINDFVICLGYKGYFIKEYFSNYFLHMSDVTFDMRNNEMNIHQTKTEPWRITLVDTGLKTMTGGRLKRIAPYVGDQNFCFTYGDGLTDLDISKVIAYHDTHGGIATMTAVQNPGRFGAISFDDDGLVGSFEEKPKGDGGWINGGFFVLSPEVFDYVESDDDIWERKPLETIAAKGLLRAYKHDGFWYAMDTLRDKLKLEALWESGAAPWKVW